MVTSSCHCKLSLAIYAVNSVHALKKIPIGVSKKVCWLCQRFLQIFCRFKHVSILCCGCWYLVAVWL